MAFEKILCPIDFSRPSEEAMGVAVALANDADAELVISHVWYVPPSAATGFACPPQLLEDIAADAERGLELALRDARTLGARRVTTQLLTGTPWLAIVELLEQGAYDLVVIGTHGRTGMPRVLLGSVAEKVVRHAPCSVLAVRPGAKPPPFTHILCPVDFSASSRHALGLAEGLVRPGGAGITLLHSIELPVSYSGDPPSPDFLRELDKQAAELLESWAAQTRARVTVPVTTRSRIGRAGAQTLAVLEADPTFDLVVMGSHGRTGIKRALLGSVAEKVVRHARSPVLVTRTRE